MRVPESDGFGGVSLEERERDGPGSAPFSKVDGGRDLSGEEEKSLIIPEGAGT